MKLLQLFSPFDTSSIPWHRAYLIIAHALLQKHLRFRYIIKVLLSSVRYMLVHTGLRFMELRMLNKQNGTLSKETDQVKVNNLGLTEAKTIMLVILRHLNALRDIKVVEKLRLTTRRKYPVVSVFPGMKHKCCNEPFSLLSFSVLLHDHNQDGSSVPRGYGWEGVCSSRWG